MASSTNSFSDSEAWEQQALAVPRRQTDLAQQHRPLVLYGQAQHDHNRLHVQIQMATISKAGPTSVKEGSTAGRQPSQHGHLPLLRLEVHKSLEGTQRIPPPQLRRRVASATSRIRQPTPHVRYRSKNRQNKLDKQLLPGLQDSPARLRQQ